MSQWILAELPHQALRIFAGAARLTPLLLVILLQLLVPSPHSFSWLVQSEWVQWVLFWALILAVAYGSYATSVIFWT